MSEEKLMKCEFADCPNIATHEVYFKEVYISRQNPSKFAGNVCQEHADWWNHGVVMKKENRGDVPVYNEEGHSNEEKS